MYDVIVVGAGPAGSSTAYNCAKKGLKTLLIDQRIKPGTPKQCAEGINEEILKELNIVIKPEWISKKIDSLIISNYKNNIILKGRRTRGYVLDRKKFDYALVERAKDAGAEVKLGIKVLNLKYNTIILKDKIEIKGKVIVGADGPYSTIGKKSGLGNPKLGCGYQYEISTQNNNHLSSLQMYVDIELENKGYLWIFPKEKSLNVGVGSMEQRNLKAPLDKFVKKLGLENEQVVEINAGQIPLHGPLQKFCNELVLLVGDAAGHTNPLSGGGIPVAIFDGILAAEVIKKHLKDKIPLTNYQQLWWQSEFGKATTASLKARRIYLRLLKEGKLEFYLNCLGTHNINSLKQLAKLGLKIPGIINKIKLFLFFKRFMKYYKYAW
ncbi:hypothetical protein COY27_00335 [Candidatus Woesearchaeota archaeon CG_4_10_14_0_2_um_filter_33_13]|nr:MAG: hypothetical protein COY27_00335 [Candidatus Woesearchaeota archaeon CG_4_10_14_0_2_um_filter_33_13]